MADGINIEGGFDDLDLTSDFLDNTIKGVLTQFASDLQKDLVNAVHQKKVTNTTDLAQSLNFDPKSVVEFEDSVVYTLKYNKYGDFQDEGVSGTRSVFNTPYKFKNEKVGKSMAEELSKWGLQKFGIPLEYDNASSFGYATAKMVKRFGIKPTYWFRDVITDGRIEALEEQLGKSIAFAIIERA